ncbi:Ppx/GppA phosphatase family protein [uncultured Algimonas sp.]|uniref:Ppx/GppA phosphatase family protein n=1 Tax=uncultured Algimonas sp. TaxID=1547920 RepID=UPI002615C29D|nr:Ppx/GppA phosphatase family protein [uncultured Algimonas sp.]
MPDDERSGSAPAQVPDGTAAPETARRRARRRNKPARDGRRPGGSRSRTFAAIDLGTNNCRLLIARETRDGFRVIDSYSKVVKLGQDLAHTGELAQDSMDAAVEALKVCARKMKAKQVKRWRCVATEACRRASNGMDFLDRVKSESGISLEVISPRVEARLAVMGCIKLIDKTKDVALVIDIGGGSTELSWVDVRKLRDGETHKIHRPPISAWCSLPLGVVTLSDNVPEHDDRERWYGDMKEAVRQAIRDQNCDTRFVRAFEEGRGHLVGTSGTITSLAGIHLKLPYYQRDKVDGLWLRSHDAVAVARDMASRSPEDRAKEPCIGSDRARMLVAGCAIIDVICEMWPSKMIRVADRGLREGMLIGLMGAKPSPPARTEIQDAAE